MAVRDLVRAHKCAGQLVPPESWYSLRGPILFARPKRMGRKTAHRGGANPLLPQRKCALPYVPHPQRTIAGTCRAAVPARSCNWRLRSTHWLASAPQGGPDPCAPSQGAPRSGGGWSIAGHPFDPDRSDIGATPSLPVVGSPLRGGTRALPRHRAVGRPDPGRRCRQQQPEHTTVGCANVHPYRLGGHRPSAGTGCGINFHPLSQAGYGRACAETGCAAVRQLDTF